MNGPHLRARSPIQRKSEIDLWISPWKVGACHGKQQDVNWMAARVTQARCATMCSQPSVLLNQVILRKDYSRSKNCSLWLHVAALH